MDFSFIYHFVPHRNFAVWINTGLCAAAGRLPAARSRSWHRAHASFLCTSEHTLISKCVPAMQNAYRLAGLVVRLIHLKVSLVSNFLSPESKKLIYHALLKNQGCLKEINCSSGLLGIFLSLSASCRSFEQSGLREICLYIIIQWIPVPRWLADRRILFISV